MVQGLDVEVTSVKFLARKSKAEPEACGADVETGLAQQGDAGGKRSPVELKGWSVEVQPAARKSTVKSGQQETKVKPEGQGSLVDPE